MILRDYAVNALGNYAKTGVSASTAVFPVLKVALKEWEGKHARHVLEGLYNVALNIPDTRSEIYEIAAQHIDHSQKVVIKTAKRLIQMIDRDRK